MKIKSEWAFTWGTSESLCSEVLLHVSPKRVKSQDQRHNIQPSHHTTDQILLKIYNEELPKSASGMRVYSKPKEKTPEQVRSSKVDRCLSLHYSRSTSWDKVLYKWFIWEMIPGVPGRRVGILQLWTLMYLNNKKTFSSSSFRNAQTKKHTEDLRQLKEEKRRQKEQYVKKSERGKKL